VKQYFCQGGCSYNQEQQRAAYQQQEEAATATTTATMGLLPSFRLLFLVIVHPTQQQQQEAVTTASAMTGTIAVGVVLPPLLRESFPLLQHVSQSQSPARQQVVGVATYP